MLRFALWTLLVCLWGSLSLAQDGTELRESPPAARGLDGKIEFLEERFTRVNEGWLSTSETPVSGQQVIISGSGAGVVVSKEGEFRLTASEIVLQNSPVDVLSKANAQRQQLIQSLQALQDAYCRAAQLDEALEVREMIQKLEQQAAFASHLSAPRQSSVTTTLPSSTAVPAAPLDAAWSIRALRGQNGTVVYRRVTGSKNGATWGGSSQVYTDDSDIATAAVHAGVVSEGQTAVIRLSIQPGNSSYPAIEQNGVKSDDWHQFGGSFRIEGAGLELSDTYAFRGESLRPFAVYVVGSSSGAVYGNKIYTDDSDIATAAVHARLLKPGEAGFVLVQIMPGQTEYESSTRNGITTRSYRAWDGSYQLMPYDPSEPLRAVPTLRSKTGGFGNPHFQLDVF